MAEKEYLTKEKFDEFKKELELLKTIKRKEVAENLEYAKSLGDLSENAEYHEARDMQANLEDQIKRIEEIIKNTSIVSASAHSSSEVTIGSVITVKKEGENSTRTYSIVGSAESDTATGKISMKSPLGLAIMGKKKGDTFSFSTPGGMISYKIIDIK